MSPIATEYRATYIPERQRRIFVVLRGGAFLSVHTTLAHAVREAQAHQGALHLTWTQLATAPGVEAWVDQRQVWRIQRCLLDP